MLGNGIGCSEWDSNHAIYVVVMRAIWKQDVLERFGMDNGSCLQDCGLWHSAISHRARSCSLITATVTGNDHDCTTMMTSAQDGRKPTRSPSPVWEGFLWRDQSIIQPAESDEPMCTSIFSSAAFTYSPNGVYWSSPSYLVLFIYSREKIHMSEALQCHTFQLLQMGMLSCRSM